MRAKKSIICNKRRSQNDFFCKVFSGTKSTGSIYEKYMNIELIDDRVPNYYLEVSFSCKGKPQRIIGFVCSSNLI